MSNTLFEITAWFVCHSAIYMTFQIAQSCTLLVELPALKSTTRIVGFISGQLSCSQLTSVATITMHHGRTQDLFQRGCFRIGWRPWCYTSPEKVAQWVGGQGGGGARTHFFRHQKSSALHVIDHKEGSFFSPYIPELSDKQASNNKNKSHRGGGGVWTPVPPPPPPPPRLHTLLMCMNEEC